MKLYMRVIAKREDGRFGVLCIEDPIDAPRPFATTCERTFENKRTVIQAHNTYRCKRTWYHKGGYETFEILVPGHSRVLFHKGNKETDSEACVLVAESFTFYGQTQIGDSKGGFGEFMALMKGVDEFDLVVIGD